MNIKRSLLSLKLLESINCYVPKKTEEIKPGFVAFAK
jgi:hypothetical protein